MKKRDWKLDLEVDLMAIVVLGIIFTLLEVGVIYAVAYILGAQFEITGSDVGYFVGTGFIIGFTTIAGFEIRDFIRWRRRKR